jgi:hypothetical protein
MVGGGGRGEVPHVINLGITLRLVVILMRTLCPPTPRQSRRWKRNLSATKSRSEGGGAERNSNAAGISDRQLLAKATLYRLQVG